jgi:serine/threonine protein kinase/tetratricopeptide (TPR) repeat protein
MRATVVPEVGKKYGPYEIQGHLGGGGMGFVYRAWDARLHREVAIKLLHSEYTMPGMRERFLREARAASALNHPNICTIFDIGEQSGEPYLVMELLQGQTLKDLIDYRSPSVDEILCIGRETAEALGAAHAKGVIHRDIKPANIFLVDKPNGGVQSKVLDFGLAKFQGGVLGARSNRALDLTAAGATVGTLAYMSPEQARGEVLDSRSDLFSLGVVMYEMATRHIPFPGATSALVFVQLLNHQPESVRNWNDSIPRELDRIILKLMAKERTQRFQTAQELDEALAKVGDKGGGWLRKATSNVPLVRAADPVAREKKVRKPSDSQLAAARPSGDPARQASGDAVAAQPPQPVSGDPRIQLRPAARAAQPDIAAAALAKPRSGGQIALDSASGQIAASTAAASVDQELTDSDEFAAAVAEPYPQRPSTRPEREASRIRRPPITPARIIIACVVLLAGLAVFYLIRHGHFGPVVLTPQDAVVLTDIENRTGDKALDGVVRSGLQIALAESPYLRLVDSGSYFRARRQIAPDDAGSSTGHVVDRNTAEKLQAKAYIFGQITGESAPYLIHLDLLNTSSNDILASAEEHVPSIQQVPAAIDRLAVSLRSSAGESSDSITKSSVPLTSEATTDLDALSAFSQGDAAYSSGQTLDALRFYQHAAQLQPKFIQAQLRLVVLYRKERAELAAAEAAKLALAAADGASARTRAIAQYEYEMNASGDYLRAIAIIRQVTSANPHDADALARLARALRLEGRIGEALQTSQQAINEDPYNLEAYIQEENSLIGLDRYDAAAQSDTQAQRLGLPHAGGAITAAYLGGRNEILAAAIASDLKQKNGFRPDWNYGIYLDNVGRLAAGAALWHARAAQALEVQGLESASAFLLSQGALDRALIGDCPSALGMAKEADAKPEGITALFNVGMADALCGNSARAAQAADQLQQTYPQSFAVKGFYVADIKAAIALSNNDPNSALDLLKSAQQNDLISLTPLLRGRAHVALHFVQIGIVDFQTVLAHRGVPFIVGNVSYPVAQIGVARAFAATGDQGNSAAAYRRFLDLWANADPGQPLVTEARAHSH